MAFALGVGSDEAFKIGQLQVSRLMLATVASVADGLPISGIVLVGALTVKLRRRAELFDDIKFNSLLCALKRPSTQWEEETTRAIVDWARKLTSGFGGQPPGLKPRDKGRLGRLSDRAGRNASERRAGLEKNNVDADPATERGRLPGVGKQSTRAPAPSTGVVATACRRRVDGRQGRPGAVGIATRTSPAGDGQSGRRRGS